MLKFASLLQSSVVKGKFSYVDKYATRTRLHYYFQSSIKLMYLDQSFHTQGGKLLHSAFRLISAHYLCTYSINVLIGLPKKKEKKYRHTSESSVEWLLLEPTPFFAFPLTQMLQQ